MAAATAEYEKLFELCEVTHDPYSCKASGDFCDNEVGKYFTEEYMSGRRSPHDGQHLCTGFHVCREKLTDIRVKSAQILHCPAPVRGNQSQGLGR